MADPAASRLRVLVVGGTGVFGGRVVRGLVETTGFDVVAAGRDRGRLTALARSYEPSVVGFLAMDTETVTAADIRAAGVFAVVDAAGPYQNGDYRLASAAMEAGAHYLDLSDGRAFVSGFSSLDAAARKAGVVALSGASSTPALANAVLDTLTAGWKSVYSVEIAICPGNQAPRGLSVIRAILSYAGRPVKVFTGGEWTTRPGWGMTVSREIPGLGKRLLSLSETPDLDIVPARFAVSRSVIFRAGLELRLMHLGLLVASLPVRAGLLNSLGPFAAVFRRAATWVERMGTDQGGMTVEARGTDAAGSPARSVWTLVAGGGDGPYVPTFPVLAALRGLADGRIAEAGASACVGVLRLHEIEAEYSGRCIRSAVVRDGAAPSLYEQSLGDRFTVLPASLQALHRPGWGAAARGAAKVDGPRGLIARIAAWIFRFPPAAEEVAVSVEITPETGRERWTRDFGGKRFTSVLSLSREPGKLIETFGPFSFDIDLLASASGVDGMPVTGWRAGRLPLPAFLAPVSIATERVDAEGRFFFDVEMQLPLGLGRLVRYRGWLVPC